MNPGATPPVVVEVRLPTWPAPSRKPSLFTVDVRWRVAGEPHRTGVDGERPVEEWHRRQCGKAIGAVQALVDGEGTVDKTARDGVGAKPGEGEHSSGRRS